ncbi:hypothetical protein BJX64DRAFT_90803 [Aspergillus heterothallicus]
MHSQSPSTTSSPPATSSRRLSVGTKSRTCVHCGRSFRRTEHLERHVRTHTKEKPYTCYCGAAFSRRDLLKRHMGIAGHEETNPPTKNSKSQSQIDRENTKQRIRRASKSYRAPLVSESPPVQDIVIPPSPEEASEMAQWTMQQPYNNVLESPSTDASHDPEILEAAQLLLPGSLPQNYTPAHPSPPPTLTYISDDFNHFNNVTNFLDSLNVPIEWSDGHSHHGNDIHAHNSSTYPGEVPETALHPFFRERDSHRTRTDSSWHLPPDQSTYAGIGMVSDYASNIYHYHPPEDLAGRCA